MHAGEKGVASGGAALLGVVVHEDRTLLADAVDVGRFPNRYAAVVDARLHPTDVVAHDEQDVRLLLCEGWCAREPYHGEQRDQTEPCSVFVPHLCLLFRLSGALSIQSHHYSPSLSSIGACIMLALYIASFLACEFTPASGVPSNSNRMCGRIAVAGERGHPSGPGRQKRVMFAAGGLGYLLRLAL